MRDTLGKFLIRIGRKVASSEMTTVVNVAVDPKSMEEFYAKMREIGRHDGPSMKRGGLV